MVLKIFREGGDLYGGGENGGVVEEMLTAKKPRPEFAKYSG